MGPRGAVRMFGPQKGLGVGLSEAERDEVLAACDGWMAAYGARLTAARDALDGSSEQVGRPGARPKSLLGVPGSGAAGGLGAALLALGAELVPGIEAVLGMAGFDDAVRAADLVVTGVTVSSDDCEPGWIFVAIPGLTQHGIRFAHAAIEAGASVILTDEEGRVQAHERGLGTPVVQVADPRGVVPALCANVYSCPSSRLTTMAVTGTNGKTTTSYLMRGHRLAFPPGLPVWHRRDARRTDLV